jgi:hypothetical protein
MSETKEGGGMKIENLTGLEKPLLKLIDVCANGIGAVAAPWLIRRQAEAIAQAQRLLSDSNMAIESAKLSYLPDQIAARVAYREAKRQENLAKVVSEAKASLPENVSDKPVNSDWTSRFFSAAQDVSDEDMQKLWGRLLSGEVSQPGSFSLRTLDLVRNLATEEARAFSEICDLLIDGFLLINPWSTDLFAFEDEGKMSNFNKKTGQLNIGPLWPDLVKIYESRGITHSMLRLLDGAGLLSYEMRPLDSMTLFVKFPHDSMDAKTSIGSNRLLRIKRKTAEAKAAFVGVQLTPAGTELRKINVPGETPDFDEALVRLLSGAGFIGTFETAGS